MKKKIIIPTVAVVLILIMFFAWIIYVNDYYHAVDVDDYMEDSESVKVSAADDGWLFDGSGTQKALIFYPGAKVEAIAYSPLMYEMAESGVDCFLVKMPSNLAIFGINKANDIIDEYDYEEWYIAGHSLGGAMAANYCYNNADEINGLVLLAAYSTKDLSNLGIPVLSIYGEKDGVLNRDKYEEYKDNLPENYKEVIIEGGNHSGFGNYGFQKEDGKADISGHDQKNITAGAIEEWINEN